MKTRSGVFAIVCILLVALCGCEESLVPSGEDGRIARVIVVSGQSNATGNSFTTYLSENPGTYRHAFIDYLTEDENASGGFVNVQPGFGTTEDQFGPEIGIAQEFAERLPDTDVFIIKRSYNGAGLSDGFNPTSDPKGFIYESLVAFVRESLESLEALGYEPQLVGFCWMQGETDATLGLTSGYAALETALFEGFKAEFSSYGAADMVIVDAGISEFWSNHEALNQAKQSVAATCSNVFYIDTIGEGLTTANEPEGNVDLAHYDAESELLLGRLFARPIIEALTSVQ